MRAGFHVHLPDLGVQEALEVAAHQALHGAPFVLHIYLKATK
jgi:hypothetical protein